MTFFNTYYGELAALLTAICWTLSAIFYEFAGRKIGSLSVNILRLGMAFIMLSIFNLFASGSIVPLNATFFQWFWLAMSGVVGFVIGDLMLFQAYVVIGARVSMLIMALAPIFAAFTGWLILGESMNSKSLIGMTVTFIGIAMVVLNRKTEAGSKGSKFFNLALKQNPTGLLLALGGAFGQGVGLVLSKYGMKGTGGKLPDIDPFASSQIRIIAGIIGFSFVFTFLKKWDKLFAATKEHKPMLLTFIGSIFGPFLGVSFSLLAVAHTSAGIAATLMSIVPVIIIFPSIFVFKEKISLHEIAGAIVSTIGVAVFFM